MRYWLLMALYVSFSLLAKPVRISFSEEDFVPFYFVKGEKWQGFSFEYITVLLEQAELEYQIVRLPWKRTLKLLQSGDIDVEAVIYRTPERQRFVTFSREAYFIDDVVVFCTRDCDFGYDGSLTQLYGKGIHVVRGYSYGATFDNAALVTSAVDSEPQLHQLAKAGRIRLGASYLASLQWSELYLSQPGIQILMPPIDREKVHFAISKKGRLSKTQIQRLQQVNSQFIASDAYLKLLKKYSLEQGSVR